ncbi:MAG: VPLPA-CTERM sorting domain-containing protein [Parvularculaceae bacterium]
MFKKFGFAAVAAAVLSVTPAHAGLVLIGVFDGNDNVSGNNNGVNNDIHDEIFAYNMDTTVEQLAKIDICPIDSDGCQPNGQKPTNGAVSAALFSLTNNVTSGSVSFDLTGTGKGLEYVALKSSTKFALFYWDMDPLVGMFQWDLAGLITNQKGETQGLSHITFYGGDYTPPSDVPLPAAAWLMLAGLGGLRFAGRKKA